MERDLTRPERACYRVLRPVTRVVEVVVVISMAVIAFTMLLQVILRYGLHRALPWPEELARYLLIEVTFLAAYLGVLEEAHLGLDLFVKRLPPSVAKVVLVIGHVGVSIFLLGLVVMGVQHTWLVADQFTPALQMSKATFYVVIPIASLLMLIVYIARILGTITHGQDGRKRTATGPASQ